MRGQEKSGTFKLPQYQEAQGLAKEARLRPHTSTLPTRTTDSSWVRLIKTHRVIRLVRTDRILQKEMGMRLRGHWQALRQE